MPKYYSFLFHILFFNKEEVIRGKLPHEKVLKDMNLFFLVDGSLYMGIITSNLLENKFFS